MRSWRCPGGGRSRCTSGLPAHGGRQGLALALREVAGALVQLVDRRALRSTAPGGTSRSELPPRRTGLLLSESVGGHVVGRSRSTSSTACDRSPRSRARRADERRSVRPRRRHRSQGRRTRSGRPRPRVSNTRSSRARELRPELRPRGHRLAPSSDHERMSPFTMFLHSGEGWQDAHVSRGHPRGDGPGGVRAPPDQGCLGGADSVAVQRTLYV